jgi:hypothetical protein
VSPVDLGTAVRDAHRRPLARGVGSPRLGLMPSQDERTTKNRVHFDLRPDGQQAEVQRLEGLGARRIDIGQADVIWVGMADPEGNELPPAR